MNKVDYLIDDYWKPGDGGVNDPDSPQTDFSLAFQRIVDEVIQREQTQRTPLPLRIQFTGRPIYHFKQPLVVTTSMTLVGTGGCTTATMLSFAGCPGIITKLETSGLGAGHTRIEGLVLRYTALLVDPGTIPLQERHGITLLAASFIHDVFIKGFPGHGIHAFGNVFATPKSNVNLTNVSFCAVYECGLSGVYLKGHDANACLIQAVNSSSNGKAAVAGDGYGFFDESAIGNTYISCHSYGNKSGGYFCNRDVRPRPDDPNGGRPISYAMLINCYTEGEPQSETTNESLILSTSDGGLNNHLGNGYVIHTGVGCVHMNSTLFSNKQEDPRLRIDAKGSLLFRFDHKDDPNGYQFVYDLRNGTKTWSFKHSGLDARTALSLTGTGHKRGEGVAVANNGLLLGKATQGNVFRKLIYAAKAALPKSPVQGDIVLNTSPTASPPNNFIGWVCIVGGDNPKWHKFGAIESTPDTTVASMTFTSDELVEATLNQSE